MAPADVLVLDKETGLYKVRGNVWPVGPRYNLEEHIGSGSYGDVCRAWDREAKETVALKRIPDIMCCPMLAKRVLREVCIMRRIQHPYIIKLSDVFTCKSSEAEEGIDLYIATEFADGGDLYRMRRPLSRDDVRLLLWQLLGGVRYLHSCHVWHRDIKSENTLLLLRGDSKSESTLCSANMAVKICDFGLARSALGANEPPTPRTNITATTAVATQVVAGVVTPRRQQRVLQRSYTRTVVTPSYRAPEVVMSRGQYTSAIDIWSLGCIFWELLQRQMQPSRVGPPARPLFGVRGEPATPEQGEAYVDSGDSPLAEQLDIIFNVVGTPTWRDIEVVPSEQWRGYLKRLPGRSGNLFYSMRDCEREALDLLSRMLAFDPNRRCTADEALAHTYFKGMRKPMELPPLPLPGEERLPLLPNVPYWKIDNPAIALGLLERELEISAFDSDGGRYRLESLLTQEAETQRRLFLLREPQPAPSLPTSGEPPDLTEQLDTGPPAAPFPPAAPLDMYLALNKRPMEGNVPAHLPSSLSTRVTVPRPLIVPTLPTVAGIPAPGLRVLRAVATGSLAGQAKAGALSQGKGSVSLGTAVRGNGLAAQGRESGLRDGVAGKGAPLSQGVVDDGRKRETAAQMPPPKAISSRARSRVAPSLEGAMSNGLLADQDAEARHPDDTETQHLEEVRDAGTVVLGSLLGGSGSVQGGAVAVAVSGRRGGVQAVGFSGTRVRGRTLRRQVGAVQKAGASAPLLPEVEMLCAVAGVEGGSAKVSEVEEGMAAVRRSPRLADVDQDEVQQGKRICLRA